ncbi:MAG TPA: type II secretion system F family protein [Streptosporangiaceae bacterium]|jgi:Flp pilus assembly protein TadB
MSGAGLYPLLGIVAGAVVGGALFLLIVAIRGLEPKPPSTRASKLEQALRDVVSTRGAVALVLGAVTLLATRWVVAAIGIALLALGWRSLGGAASERRAMDRLEGLAAWTESLRDTIAGAVGLEQAIPSSLRAAAPSLREPLARLVDRLHTRMPMPDALRRFADDIDDPGADLIIAALIINSRLRGPGLRDLLTGLSGSVREELDVRRKVNAERRSTRRSVQIVVLVAVAVALLMAIFNHHYVQIYDSAFGQVILVVVAGFYAAGFFWLRRLAHFDSPERLLTESGSPAPGGAPQTVAAWRQQETVSAGPRGDA